LGIGQKKNKKLLPEVTELLPEVTELLPEVTMLLPEVTTFCGGKKAALILRQKSDKPKKKSICPDLYLMMSA